MDEEIKISGNIDINQALNEFETKEKQEQTKSYEAVKFYKETSTPKMVLRVMKWTGAKEQKQAEWILLGFVVVAIGISLYLVFGRSGGGNYPKIDSAALEKLMQTPPAEIPSINSR